MCVAGLGPSSSPEISVRRVSILKVSLVFNDSLVKIEHRKQFCVLSFTGYENPVIFHAALLLVKRERRMEGEDGFYLRQLYSDNLKECAFSV